jgi:hypothetical protein
LAAASPWHVPNLCERSQIADGQWVPKHVSGPPYLPPSNITRCGPTALHDPPKGWDTYRWVPNDSVARRTNRTACHFTEWNRDVFCELAMYATVMVLGDSLSWESYASLVLLLGANSTPHEGYQKMSRIRNVNVGHAVCGGRSRIVYRRDDYLLKVRHALFESESNIPQVLVLNRGAHYANDTDLMIGVRSALDVVEEWLDRCDQLKIKCHFFWRTTVPGHHHCHTFKAPVNDLAAMEAHIANLSLYDVTARRWHWYDFQHQNLLVEAELKDRSHLPHRILDGYRINVLRPDHHTSRDCLHSCYPGKMDLYPQLLLHYLRSDRSSADVQRLRSVVHEQRWNLNVTTVAVYDAW